MQHLNRADIYNRLQAAQSCSTLWMVLYQSGALLVTVTLLALSTHWMLTTYAVCLQVLAFSASRLLNALRQPLADMPNSATELASLLVDRMNRVQGEFWWLCACAVVTAGLGVLMAVLYGSTFLFAVLPVVMSMPFFKRLRAWGWIARRVCMARKMETFDRFHPQHQSV